MWLARDTDARRLRPARAPRLGLAAAAALIACAVSLPAHAADVQRALVICAQCVTDADSAIEESVRVELRKTGRFEVLPAPALDLEAVQLSIDCPDQNARCLREVANRLETDVLLVTEISRQSDGTRLRVLYFDARSDAEPSSESRTQPSAKGRHDWTGELPALLRELLPEPASKPEPKAATPAVEPESAPTEADSAAGAAPTERAPGAASDGAGELLPLGPVLLGGGGLAVVAAGLITGAIMRGTENDYAARTVDSPEQAELAEAERSRGRTQAVVANVLLGTGVAAIVAAGVWLAMDLREPDEPQQVTLSPVLGPRGVGVLVSSPWELSP